MTTKKKKPRKTLTEGQMVCAEFGITMRQLIHVRDYYEIADIRIAAEIAKAKGDARKKAREKRESALSDLSYTTITARVSRGMSLDDAVSKPLVKRSKDPMAKKAVANGISEPSYYRRVRHGWDKETAATKPVRPMRVNRCSIN